MMVPNEGKLFWAGVASGQVPFCDFEVQLYTNNYTPVDGSTAADFTPATFTGSGVWTVAEADWNMPALVSNEAITDATPAPTWTHGGGAAQVCYGWFAVEVDNGAVVMAQRFDVARNMTSGSIESLDPFEFRLKTYA